MSAFTDFIQLELPKRPVLETDIEANSIPVRNGVTPRGLVGVKLEPGQIIMNLGGTVQAVNLADVTGDTDNHTHVQDIASATWTVAHGGTTENFLITVTDADKKVVHPEEIEVIDAESIRVTFLQPTAGKACVVHFS